MPTRTRTDVTWGDGKPVEVGQTAMSPAGPMRIDGIEVMANGSWRLWSNVSWMGNGEKWLYIIDEGQTTADHPTREGEPCKFWKKGDNTTPRWVFAPRELDIEDWSV